VSPRGDFDRSARNAQTRERLLAAAASVYARSGVSGATLDDVAAEAGFTKGAVYSQFGSKENLLVALLHEHLAQQTAEQIAIFDREQPTWTRPQVGSAHWMESLADDPDAFRLFVELWVYAQRDERLRESLADGVEAMRTTYGGFARSNASDAGINSPPQASERFASIVVGLAIGLAMVRLVDPEAVPEGLLGDTLSALVRAAEIDEETREVLAGQGQRAASRG
jgi:AcrR family transcriptional regulator